MHIKTVRILNTILTLVFIAIGKYHFITYVLINQILLEVLNAQLLYKTHPYKLYNFVFWTYELVLTERLRHFKMSGRAEWWLNSFEHICFALVIGFMLYMLLAIFGLKKDSQRIVRAIAVALLFNLIGLINELNQNRLANRPIFVFIEDSVKDLKMNLIGTCIFFLTVLCRTWWLKKKSNG